MRKKIVPGGPVLETTVHGSLEEALGEADFVTFSGSRAIEILVTDENDQQLYQRIFDTRSTMPDGLTDMHP